MTSVDGSPWRTNSSHWGPFEARLDETGRLLVRGHAKDPEPSPLLENLPTAAQHPARIARPAVRVGWLEDGPGPSRRRGIDRYVEVPWDEVLDRLASELGRIYTDHGPDAVFGGSYGWGSAGRFHHAQSQVHRFLNVLGGYVRSVNTYSLGATNVILPHVLGHASREVTQRATTWRSILEHTEVVVAFGGMAVKNASVVPGGRTRHEVGGHLRAAADRGLEFHHFSPLRDDLPGPLDATWYPLAPGTDTAVMLGLAHTLLEEGLADRPFLDRYCTGFERIERYLLGRDDGTPKTADWAAGIAQLDGDDLRRLARRMARSRTLVQTSWSLQRARHGEQPVWMSIALACMLGQVGLPGGGFGHGYASMGDVGTTGVTVALPTFPQGDNPVENFIPVARAADMLMRPGEKHDYDGQRLTYPDIRLVYWCGGNPFHHHQDLNRLRDAWSRPDTIVIHDNYWTASAKHADIVLPATSTLERNDLGTSRNDGYLHSMNQVLPPYGDARDDFRIFADLTERITGDRQRFTQGRDEGAWLRHLYGQLRSACQEVGHELPDFETFWDRGSVELPVDDDDHVLLGEFRADPDRAPLQTPSGRIELHSRRIESFGYEDCPGHPSWLEPEEWLGAPEAARFPLHLVANQPASRLHGQLDMGARSQATKVGGREPLRLHPDEALARGLQDGDVVLVHNERGRCLAGLVIDDDVRPGVAQLATGAWYDPQDLQTGRTTCVHGNPNVLTADRGTSRLAQGCTGQLTLVEVEAYAGKPPPVRAYEAPLLRDPTG